MSRSVGGVGNTPPLGVISDISIDKIVLFDYFKATFDFVKIVKSDYGTFQIITNYRFMTLLQVLKYDGSYDINEIPKKHGLYGYTDCLMIGENIFLHYGGESIKNGYGNYTMLLEMSGQGCREFERMGGIWHELFRFMRSDAHTVIKRTDSALDDFNANEIDLYKIEEHLRNGWYVSNFTDIMYYIGTRKVANGIVMKGFTIEMGSRGSNQLVMYKKDLEMKVRGRKLKDFESKVHNRYEIRFIDEKADKFIEQYLLYVDQNDSKQFLDFFSKTLQTLLVLKTSTGRAEIKKREMLPEWKDFLSSIGKIDLRLKPKQETTIERRKTHLKKSYAKFMASLYLALDQSDESYNKFMNKLLVDGLEKFEDKDLRVVNNFRKDKALDTKNAADVANEFMELLVDLEGGFSDDEK